MGSGHAFDHYVTEAMGWARRAAERLGSKTDADFARVFNVIMKTPKGDVEGASRSHMWQQFNGFQSEEEYESPYKQVRSKQRMVQLR